MNNSQRGFKDTNTNQNADEIFGNAIRGDNDEIEDYQDMMEDEEFENKLKSYQQRQTQKVLVSPSRGSAQQQIQLRTASDYVPFQKSTLSIYLLVQK